MLLCLFYGVARRKVVPRRRLPRSKPIGAARNFSRALGIAWLADTDMSELAMPVSLLSAAIVALVSRLNRFQIAVLTSQTYA